MTSFLSKIEKARTLAAAQRAKGFNLRLASYLNAITFGDALDLFFTNLLSDLKELTTVYEATAVKKSAKENITQKIINFSQSTNNLLTGYIEDYIELAKAQKKSKTLNQKEELDKKIKEHKTTLTVEFDKLRADAQAYYNNIHTFDLNIHEDIVRALHIWKEITFDKFLTMLKTGKIEWLE